MIRLIKWAVADRRQWHEPSGYGANNNARLGKLISKGDGAKVATFTY
jgi:hypothetical protein